MSVSLLLVAVLLLLGVICRQAIPLIRWFYIPASVIAGFIGLALVSLLPLAEDWVWTNWVAGVKDTFASWPGPLITVVFAAMMLQPPKSAAAKTDANVTSRVGRQGLMVWIIVLGETLVGLLVTWLLIRPYFDVPNSFGFLIETGFAGGHGTAAAMGQVYASEQVGLPSGLDLGLLMATCGLVYGLISGILWINIAARLGWIAKTESHKGADEARETKGAIGYATLPLEVIDPLLLQLVWIALALGLGMLMQATVMGFAGGIDAWLGAGGAAQEGADAELSKRLAVSNLLDFPLFIYAMFGGWLVRRFLREFDQDQRIDSLTLQRISATAMEVLVVAAIASLKLSAVADLMVPFGILFVAGAIWTGVCLMVISRLILPKEHWFQLGLINYGMSTGTTATGFILLRVVDPELETHAASDYALAAPLSSPFVGGGILTIALPLLVIERVSLPWSVAALSLLIATMVGVGMRWNRPATDRDNPSDSA